MYVRRASEKGGENEVTSARQQPIRVTNERTGFSSGMETTQQISTNQTTPSDFCKWMKNNKDFMKVEKKVIV